MMFLLGLLTGLAIAAVALLAAVGHALNEADRWEER